ncbi:metallophosphoesterase [Parabacteroides sp. OttesenSCG-928-K15]|nr:metallophosphoesterase [Parabacteroides sp. OttesenSCG-928-K15]
MNRRKFLNRASLSALGAGMFSVGALEASENVSVVNAKRKLLFQAGICSDVHQDIMHDGIPRLQAFVDEMNRRKVDFIIQLGDFCRPSEQNLPFLQVWKQFKGASYHVIGNHETDGGYTQEQVVSYFDMPGRYYSFDRNGYHFVVLNGNDKNPKGDKGYPRYIGEEQRRWLADDLDKTSLPVIAFCHQGLDIDILLAVEEASFIRLIFERANQKAGFTKVKLVFSGHHHNDYHNEINGIHYVQINSMSNFWLGNAYKTLRYSEEIDKKYPYIKYTAPYKDPIWAVMSVYNNGEIAIQGKRSEFVGATPTELGVPLDETAYPVVAHISDRELK